MRLLRAARLSLSTWHYMQLRTFLFRTERKMLDVWNSFPSSNAELAFNFSVPLFKVAAHDYLPLGSAVRFHKYFQEFWDPWMKCVIKWKWKNVHLSVLCWWCLLFWLLFSLAYPAFCLVCVLEPTATKIPTSVYCWVPLCFPFQDNADSV